MTLQWYPGHMTKARRELAEQMPSKDVVIEVIDARLPKASSNPVITELRGSKPVIKVSPRAILPTPTSRARGSSTSSPSQTSKRSSRPPTALRSRASGSQSYAVISPPTAAPTRPCAP